MKKVNLELSNNEYRALQVMVDNGFNACRSGCVYEEMEGNKKDCDKCQYTLARHKLETILLFE